MRNVRIAVLRVPIYYDLHCATNVYIVLQMQFVAHKCNITIMYSIRALRMLNRTRFKTKPYLKK